MKSIDTDASRITLLVSFPYNIVIISLPQQLQVVSSINPLWQASVSYAYNYSACLAALAIKIIAGKIKISKSGESGDSVYQNLRVLGIPPDYPYRVCLPIPNIDILGLE